MAFMIRRCDDRDFESIHAIINDGAQAYRGIIPADRWTDPYMSSEHLQHEIDAGVGFWGYEETGTLIGVMGLQEVQDVTLIRHAYVRTSSQGRGIGARLLAHLREGATRPVLIGTWADAVWAIRFYESTVFESSQLTKRTGCSRSIGRSPTARLKRPSSSPPCSFRRLSTLLRCHEGRNAPHDSRTTRSPCRRVSRGGSAGRATRASMTSSAASPICCVGWRRLVSGTGSRAA
jgi:GNAT superfamily N-acetyltransferase